jgi:hypothetical protein
VLAAEPSPIAAFSTFLLEDALTMVDLETLESLMLIEPVLAVESLPIAAFKTFLLDEALTMVDLSIFEPSANAAPEAKAINANAATVCNVFMGVSSLSYVGEASLGFLVTKSGDLFTLNLCLIHRSVGGALLNIN